MPLSSSIKKRGIQATTIASIAEEAGVSKGTIHHYYKDREELIELAVRRIFTMRHEAVLKKLKIGENTLGKALGSHLRKS